MSDWLVVKTELNPSDVILILSGDSGARDVHGVHLYNKGYAPRILLSGGPLIWNRTYAQVMAEHLLSLGIPRSSLMLENRSRSSYENALFSRELLLRKGLKKVILVTSSYHMRRTLLVFQKVFKKDGVRFYPAPVPLHQSDFNPHEWWKRPEDTEKVLSEYAKLLYYKFKGWI